MAKRKHMIGVAVGCCQSNPTMPEDQQKEKYKKDYEFNHAKRARSPVDGWEHSHLMSEHSYAPKKEIDLVKGKSHGYSHRRDGNSYGNRATRRHIGSRKSK